MQFTSSLLALSMLVLSGCASQPAATPGKHLVYRDGNGEPTMQIDYPSEDFCRQVEAIARRPSKCEAKSSSGKLLARATLRYDPPGMLVEGHYPDLARCQAATARTAMGVKLVSPCSEKIFLPDAGKTPP